MGDLLPTRPTSPFLSDRTFLDDAYFRWGVQVDDLGLAAGAPSCAPTRPYAAAHLVGATSSPTPVTTAAARGRSMARDSLRQSDARLGVFLDHLEGLGVLDEVAFLLTADHGFEGADPTVTGSWRPALEALGVPYRDEGPGFVYLL